MRHVLLLQALFVVDFWTKNINVFSHYAFLGLAWLMHEIALGHAAGMHYYYNFKDQAQPRHSSTCVCDH